MDKIIKFIQMEIAVDLCAFAAQVIAIRDLAGLHLESIWQHVTDEP